MIGWQVIPTQDLCGVTRDKGQQKIMEWLLCKKTQLRTELPNDKIPRPHSPPGYKSYALSSRKANRLFLNSPNFTLCSSMILNIFLGDKSCIFDRVEGRGDGCPLDEPWHSVWILEELVLFYRRSLLIIKNSSMITSGILQPFSNVYTYTETILDSKAEINLN